MKYSQKSGPFPIITRALAANHDYVLRPNPFLAAASMYGSLMAGAAVSLFSCCFTMGLWLMFDGTSESTALGIHAVLSMVGYMVWMVRTRQTRALVPDRRTASLVHECALRLAPYASTERDTSVFGLPELTDMTVPLGSDRRADVLVTHLKEDDIKIEVSLGPWKPRLRQEQGLKHELVVPAAAFESGKGAKARHGGDVVGQVGDQISRWMLASGIEPMPGHQKGASPEKILMEPATDHPATAEFDDRSVGLEGWRNLEVLHKPQWWRRPAAQMAVYWALGAPLMLWGLSGLWLGAGPLSFVWPLMVTMIWAVSFWAWHPPGAGRKAAAGHQAARLVWEEGVLSIDSEQDNGVDLRRPFVVELTREHGQNGEEESFVNVSLNQRQSEGKVSRVRFCVATQASPALERLPEMVLRAPRLPAQSFHRWVWPLLRYHNALHHGQSLGWQVSMATDAELEPVKAVQQVAEQAKHHH